MTVCVCVINQISDSVCVCVCVCVCAAEASVFSAARISSPIVFTRPHGMQAIHHTCDTDTIRKLAPPPPPPSLPLPALRTTGRGRLNSNWRQIRPNQRPQQTQRPIKTGRGKQCQGCGRLRLRSLSATGTGGVDRLIRRSPT